MDNQEIRAAAHAGSWYSKSKRKLVSDLTSYLNDAKKHSQCEMLKGIIVPHAGYRWSGPTAAWGYINISPEKYSRVVVLGPSHHAYFQGCSLTQCKELDTPLGKIQVDTNTLQSLAKLKGFSLLDIDTDENEHSLEMQFPFLRHLFGAKDFQILPIMVGATDLKTDRYFASCLAELYKDKETLFVISSDFCHWGQDFDYTYFDKSFTNIYESIEDLDKKGMDTISSLSAEKFNKYLKDTGNTICGERPISIFLSTIEECLKSEKNENKIEFVKYDQSEKVTDMNGQSVSYAVGLNILG